MFGGAAGTLDLFSFSPAVSCYHCRHLSKIKLERSKIEYLTATYCSFEAWLAVCWLLLSNVLSISEWWFFFVSNAENDITEIPSQLQRKMCDQMDEDQDISSVAHQPFPFKSAYFPVHFRIHFRCITKLYSLSSLRCPIGQEILHRKRPWVKLKSKLK